MNYGKSTLKAVNKRFKQVTFRVPLKEVKSSEYGYILEDVENRRILESSTSSPEPQRMNL